jgi:uncharacterized protein
MEYRRRLADSLLDELLAAVPAVILFGPRAAGKTTTASRRAATIVRLNRPAESGVFRADPDAALDGLREPVLLDEWQAVPDVLGALKRSVDGDSHPGHFVVTGSVRARLRDETWPGTGRLVSITLHGMNTREMLSRFEGPLFLDRLAASEQLRLPEQVPDIKGYVDLALRSGFPDAIGLEPRVRRIWLNSYLEQLVTRDAAELEERRDPIRLRRFLSAWALNSAGIVSDQTLLDAAGINRRTADAYEHLLTDLFVLDSLPAWTINRLSRLTSMRKRFVADTGLLATLINADSTAILAHSDLLGRFIESFVVAQLRAEVEFCLSSPRLYHLRERDGRREIDIIVEYRGGRVAGIEVKAAAAVRVDDARSLQWLRDQIGERFLGGVVLHTGPNTFRLDSKIVAAPIATLWG